jgi:hypothetical protein
MGAVGIINGVCQPTGARAEGRAEFGCGRTAGAVDLLHWLDDRNPAHLKLHTKTVKPINH